MSAFETEVPQYVLWAPVGLGVGIILYFSLATEPGLMLPLVVFLGGLALWWIIKPRAILKYFILGIALAGLGFLAAGIRTLSVTAPTIRSETGPVEISGRVILVEPIKENQTRVTLEDLTIEGLDPDETPRRIRLTVRTGTENINPGVRASTVGVLLPPSPPTMPGGFDFSRLAFFQRLGAVGYTIRPLVGDREAGESVDFTIADVRLRVAERVRSSIEGPSGTVAAAFLTGLRRAIPEEVNIAMRRSGLAHLLAISGLHMALVTGIIFFAVRAAMAAIPVLALRWPLKKISALMAFGAGFGYLALSGMAISTQRAFFMVSIVLLAVLLERRALSMRLVAMAAFVILLVQPESLLSASFQMSFTAVVGLVAGFRAIRGRVSMGKLKRRNIFHMLLFYLATVMFSTMIAEVTIGPIAAYHFHRFNAYGLLANLIAMPVMGFWVMPLLVLSLLLMPCGLDGVPLYLAGQGLDVILGTARMVSGLPGASILVAAVPVTALVIYWVGGLWLAFWRSPRLRLWGLVPLLLVLTSPFWQKPADLLVAPDGKLVAIKSTDGRYYFSSRRSERFARERWQEQAAQVEAPLLSELDAGLYHCDDLGCLYEWQVTSGRHRIALPGSERALAEDCRMADIIITSLRTPAGCGGSAVVIDRAKLLAEGGHAIWFEENGEIVIRSVEELRGNRPWTWGRNP